MVPVTSRPCRSTAPSLNHSVLESANGLATSRQVLVSRSQKARPVLVTSRKPPFCLRRIEVAGSVRVQLSLAPLRGW